MSARKDTLGSGVGFSSSGGIRVPLVKVFLILWIIIGVFLGFVLEFVFNRFSHLNLVAWSLKNTHVVSDNVQSQTFHKCRDSLDLRIIF